MISVIIPSYKNKELLLKNLKNNLSYFKDCEVIVVNDYPDESLKDDLKNLPIKLIENIKNLGFAGAVNRGISQSSRKYILLLNSDVELSNDNFKKALDHFSKNKNLFAVSFAQEEKDGSIVGKNKFFWQSGFFQHSKGDDLDFGLNGWAEGGASIVDKEKFDQLGGFDEIYKPFYWEDIDLSYRAWKSGYGILFDPSIKVVHPHESTIGKYFTSKWVKKIAYRNQLIFIWKNITDFSLVFNHLFLFIPNLLSLLFRGQFSFLTAIIQAKLRLPQIAQKRHVQKKLYKLRDSEVLNIFHKHL